MAGSVASARSRVMSLRRQIILARRSKVFEAQGALIVRWIGARSRKNLPLIAAVAPSMGPADNVIALRWSETFGRPAVRWGGPGEASAVVLAMAQYSAPATSGPGAAIRRA